MASLRFLVLASGSKGNCAYLASEHAQVLFDCGISPRRIFSGLREQGIAAEQLDALFISHTHSDHISGVENLLRRLPRLRVYCPAQHAVTLQRLAPAGADIQAITPDEGFIHRDMDVLPVSVSHDCRPTVMYKVYSGGASAGLLTDLGCTTPLLTRIFGDCDALLLESNHCEEMLQRGPYPEMLKRRIRGDNGHLSNRQAANFAEGLERLPRLLLGHLSDDNNSPEAASSAFLSRLLGLIPHQVIPQRAIGPLLEL